MTAPAVGRIPDPPDPPDHTCFNDVELSLWRLAWTCGYIAALHDHVDTRAQP